MPKLNLFFIFTLMLSCSIILNIRLKRSKRYDEYITKAFLPKNGQIIRPNYNPESDANALRKAVKGWGTDEDAINKVIASTTWYERQQIRLRYGAMGRDLYNDLADDVSSDYGHLVLSCFKYPPEYYADELYDSIYYTWGTDEDGLNDIFITRTNKEILNAKMYYDYNYKVPLENAISNKIIVAGYYEKILLAMAKGKRSENPTIDETQCKNDANTLKAAAGGSFGDDEETFTMILTSRSYPNINRIAQLYKSVAGKSLADEIKDQFTGDVEDVFLDILDYAESPYKYYARRMREAVKGAGTNERKIDRVMLLGTEVGYSGIIKAYKEMYKRDMIADIKDDTSGDYKDLLKKMLGE